MWSAREINAMKERLQSFKEALETRLLFSISESLDAQSIRTSTRFDNLDMRTRQIISSILETRIDVANKMSKEFQDGMKTLTITITHLLSRLESMNHDNHRETRDIILRRICEGKGLKYLEQQLIADVELLDVSDSVEQQLQISVQEGVLRNTGYPEMTYRYEDIVEAHPKTFEWAFHDPIEEQYPWSNLSDWLKRGRGVYWINGKAGSGKSTFMKLLFDKKQTREYLQTWAKDTHLCVATFFFWNSGSKEQKSQAGFLRALLFQILQQYPELVPLVLPAAWSEFYSRAIQTNLNPEHFTTRLTLPQLMAGLQNLIRQTAIPLKICFLVDGLDEFDGDHEAIARLFKEITNNSNTKVCLSSRPWVVFEDLFGNCPKLILQHLSYRDIERYVRDRFSQSESFQRLAEKEPMAASKLLHEVVKKADGVFLWVKLVVQSLLTGMRNRDEVADLQERLRLLPPGLKPLYNRLFELIEPTYLLWVAKAFQIVRVNRILAGNPFKKSVPEAANLILVRPLSLSAFLLAICSEDTDLSKLQTRAQLLSACEDTMVRLTARCAGFLEVSKRNASDSIMGSDCLIQYFHRTARDFLELEARTSWIWLQTAHTDFNPNVAMMRSCIRSLQIEPLLMELDKKFDHDSRWKRTHIINLAYDTMAYAYHSEPHQKSNEVRRALLDQLYSVMDIHDTGWINMIPWIIDTIASNGRRYGSFDIFLGLATLFNLRSYVGAELGGPAESATDKSELATTLLRLFLNPNESWLLPLPRTEMVSLLLERGVDPNGCGKYLDGCASASPWQNALSYSTSIRSIQPSHPQIIATSKESMHLYSKLGVPALDQDILETRPRRNIEIMMMLVSSGADPHARTAEYWEKTKEFSALEIVNSFLLKNFPLEAAPLSKSLQRAILAIGPGKREQRIWLKTQDRVEDKGRLKRK